MKKLRVFSILVCILLLGFPGCITPLRSPSLDELHRRAMAATDENLKMKAKRGPSIVQIMNSWNSWKGHQISEFIRQKGPATQISPDGADGQIYIWVEAYQRSVPQIYPSQQTTTRGTTRWILYFGNGNINLKHAPAVLCHQE